VASRLSRHSYGFLFSLPFDSSEHLLQDKFFDAVDGIEKASHQTEWLLKRVRWFVVSLFRVMLMSRQGDVVEEGRRLKTAGIWNVQVGFWDTGTREFSMALYYNDEAQPPKRWTESTYILFPSIHCKPESRSPL